MIAISAGSRSNAAIAAGLDQRQQPERLDRRAQGDDPVGIAELADDPARRRRSRRCRRGGCSPRCRCADGGRGSGATVRPRRRGASPPGAPRSRFGGRGWGGHDRSVSVVCGRRTIAGTARIPRRLLDGRHDVRPRPSTSRTTRPSCTSSPSCATSGPSRRSSARSCASCRGCSATRRWPTSASGRCEIRTPLETDDRQRARRAGRVRADPAGRARAWSTRCSS